MADQPSTKSIYDFIYLDNTKIHSYYSQLTDGLPNQKKSTVSDKKGSATKVTAGPRDMVHGQHDSNKSSEQAFEQLLDMTHTLPRYLINLLDSHGMIAKKLATNHLGKLVLVKGLLHIANVDHFSDLAEPILNIFEKADPEEYKKVMEKFTKEDVAEFTKILKAYPLDMQANLMVKDDKNKTNFTWMSLQEDYFTQSYIDFSLKHKHVSSEEFYVLGILDAIPEKFMTQESEEDQLQMLKEIMNSNTLGEFSFNINEIFKGLVGRPSNFYAMTPICIFRKIDIPNS